MVKNKSLLQFKKANCKNCYRCVRNCPVKAIRIHDQQANIIESQCILCEKCTLTCPQNAKVELNLVPEIQNLMLLGKKVVVSVHPSYLAHFGAVSFEQVRSALKKLGFADAFDAAEGGALVKTAYENYLKERNGEPIISSQCTVITLLVQRNYPSLVPRLAKLPSLLQTHAAMLKKADPDLCVVCVSPCISIMAEMNEEGNRMDYVITFAELEQWMNRKRVTVEPAEIPAEDVRLSRAMALGGGLSVSMRPDNVYHPIFINGIDNCLGVLDELKEAPHENCFLDLSACINGCVGGPSFQKKPVRLLDSLLSIKKAAMPASGIPDHHADYHPEDRIEDLLPQRDFEESRRKEAKPVDEASIRAILEQMGKHSKQDELNCGACGYNTCREKAIAISRGKAEITMCVPFMRARQESYSRKIINAMPGLLITVDYQLNIIHMNKAARDLFDIGRTKRLIGNPVAEIMDDYSLVNMIAYDKKLTQDQVEVNDGERVLDRVMTNDKDNRLILCVMKDITKEIEEKRERVRTQAAAVEMAERLMEDQLRVVHQIAGLLGETAADTKVAVEKLKSTILQETEEN